MDMSLIAQLVWRFSQKNPLTGPELMMYHSLCESIELWAKIQNNHFREALEKNESQSSSDGSTQPDS